MNGWSQISTGVEFNYLAAMQVPIMSYSQFRINASIIQGSVVGPPSYVIVASDLHPKHQGNLMTKYADDTYLMVGSNNIGTAAEEFGNIQSWAARNNLRINSNKTKELIIFRRRSKS